MTAWIKKNLLVLVLLLIIVFLFSRNFLFGSRISTFSMPAQMRDSGVASFNLNPKGEFAALPFTGSSTYTTNYPPSDASNRLVIMESSLSLMVKNVTTAIDSIEKSAKDSNGFLVNSYLNNPTESPTGNIVVRIPESNRTQFLNSIKGLAVKVVSENLTGNDVTDQYVDLDARLAVLNQTKLKFEDILTKATAVQDLLTVQRELINLQTQIDSLKGQQKYLEQSAKLSKISIYLSTDEYSLPYAPSDAWRPQVIFKQAIRSLVGTFRSLGSLLIWLAVYLPIIGLIYLIYRLIRQKFAAKSRV